VPHEPTPGLRGRRLEILRPPIANLGSERVRFISELVRGKRAGLCSDSSIQQNDASRDGLPTRVNQTIGRGKVMLTVIWGIDGFHVVDMMPPWRRFNPEYFLTHIIHPLLAIVFLDGRKRHALRLSVH
jgi:hypothetical protein